MSGVGPVVRVLTVLAGIAAVAPLVAVDPGVLGLLLDLDLLALVGAAGLGLVHADLRSAVRGLSRSLPGVWVRVGCELSRSEPKSLSA